MDIISCYYQFKPTRHGCSIPTTRANHLYPSQYRMCRPPKPPQCPRQLWSLAHRRYRIHLCPKRIKRLAHWSLLCDGCKRCASRLQYQPSWAMKRWMDSCRRPATRTSYHRMRKLAHPPSKPMSEQVHMPPVYTWPQALSVANQQSYHFHSPISHIHWSRNWIPNHWSQEIKNVFHLPEPA